MEWLCGPGLVGTTRLCTAYGDVATRQLLPGSGWEAVGEGATLISRNARWWLVDPKDVTFAFPAEEREQR
jgi:hypothetical protein